MPPDAGNLQVTTEPYFRAGQALLAELAWLACQIAPACTDVALVARSPDTADAQRGLRAACGWLQVLGGSVQAAHRADPVSATDRDLLLAIPLNAPCRAPSWTAASRSPPCTTP